MSDRATTLIGGTALLERAVGYALGSLRLVEEDAMSNPTPCRGWDLAILLAHLHDSLEALQEAADLGDVVLDGPVDQMASGADLVGALRARAGGMLGAWTREIGLESVTVGHRPVFSGFVTGAGAIEIAVHGWDVAVACGRTRPIPAALAEELLECCYLLVVPEDRPGRFALPVAVAPWSPAGDRLLGYLGRHPTG